MEENTAENINVTVTSEEPKSGNTGAIIGAIIIIVLLVAGGWYFIGNRVEKITETAPTTPTNTAEINTNLSDSTELNDIQADLDSLNVGILDEITSE